MKQIVCLIISYFIATSLYSQSSIRFNHYWENPYYVTPAYINTQSPTVFSIAGRKQWVNFDGAPTSFIATVNYFIEDWQTQFGAKIVQDQIGFTSTTAASLSFTYAIPFNEIWRLQLGVAGVFQRIFYDTSKMVLDDDTDNEAWQNLQTENHFNMDLGIEMASRSFRFGIASQNFASLFNKSYPNFPTINYAYGSFRNSTENPLDIGLGSCFILYNNIRMGEFNATAYFKSAPEKLDKFQIGAFYRTPKEFGGIFGIHFPNGLSLFYSYEYNFSTIKDHSWGTHEIMIVYKLKKSPICYSCF